ncbi:hypothetical protein JCM15765_24110 [Paradesulfitobacterium aromaticivorans]
MNDTPKIRFNEFTDKWEQRKAKGIFVSTADKGHPELPVLSATQDRGMIKRDENGIKIFHDKKNEDGYKRVAPGQFVIHLRSFQGGFAHSSIEGITSPAYTVFGFIEPENHNDIFWKYIFNSKDFIRRLATVTYGIRDGRSISYDEFLTMSFYHPQKDEQTKIAEYLTDIDNLITLHQLKYEQMMNVKKSMLGRLFPYYGSEIPQIRFGFSGNWEEVKLGDIVFPYSDPVETPRDGYIRLGIRSHGKGTFHDYVQAGQELETAQMLRVAAHKFIVNITFGWEHAVAITDEKDAGKLVSHRFPQFSMTESIDDGFLKYVILDERFKHHLFLSSPGGAGRNRVLNISQMLEYKMRIPKIEEQQQIAGLLDSVNNLINLYAVKVQKLKQIKSACLDEMFI